MKVLLVDDHPLILQALQSVIHGLGDHFHVVACATAAAARQALREDPDFDLVLLDLSLGEEDGFVVLTEFRSTYPAVPVVVVSASERTSDVIQALDSGAMGFVPKRATNAELVHALDTVMSGGLYIPPYMLGLTGYRPGQGRPAVTGAADGDAEPGTMHAGPATPRAPLGEHARAEPHQKVSPIAAIGLTPRQTEVLSLLLKGLPNKLIARELNLSVETVKDHVAAVLRALGVSTRTQAVLAVSQMTHGQGGIVGGRPRGG